MDRLLYVAMNGASRALQAQGTVSHNLANASTPGFKAALSQTEATNVEGPGWQSRVHASAAEGGFDALPGAVRTTGRSLDIALQPGTWLAVEAADGSTAYTRAGNLQIDVNGRLQTASGAAVLGGGGAIGVPPAESISIGRDGTFSIIPLGVGGGVNAEIDRIRVVQEPAAGMVRGVDGLFRPTDPAEELQPAGDEAILSGALEQSNVNPATALVSMIEQQRRFETQIQLMKKADEHAQRTAELLRMR